MIIEKFIKVNGHIIWTTSNEDLLISLGNEVPKKLTGKKLDWLFSNSSDEDKSTLQVLAEELLR